MSCANITWIRILNYESLQQRQGPVVRTFVRQTFRGSFRIRTVNKYGHTGMAITVHCLHMLGEIFAWLSSASCIMTCLNRGQHEALYTATRYFIA